MSKLKKGDDIPIHILSQVWDWGCLKQNFKKQNEKKSKLYLQEETMGYKERERQKISI